MIMAFADLKGDEFATVELHPDGTVTTTGVGDRVIEQVEVFTPTPEFRRLTPKDGATWLRALAFEMSRTGYTVVTFRE